MAYEPVAVADLGVRLGIPLRGPWLDISEQRFAGGAKESLADNSPAIQAAINTLPQAGVGQPGASGGGLLIPPGIFTCASQLSAAGRKSIRLLGSGGQTPGDAPPSQLVYTGSVSPFINAIGAFAFELNRVSVYYTNASFVGTLIDCTQGTLVQFLDCILGGTLTTAARIIDFDQGNYAIINRCTIGGAAVGLRGVATGGSFSNVVKIRDTLFSSLGAAYHLTTCGILNPGEAWIIDGCNFEPLHSGAPGAISVESAINSVGQGVLIRGCWMGDATAGGTWINTVGNIQGLTIEGNYISGPAGGTVGIATGSAFAQAGLRIVGNTFANLLTAVNIGNNTQDLVYEGNNLLGVTNPLVISAGSISSGRVLDKATNRTHFYGGIDATDGIQIKQKAGIPVDGDFAVAPPNGTLAVDTTNNKLYVRIGGTWKGVLVA